jgi:hypothetical protein
LYHFVLDESGALLERSMPSTASPFILKP